MLALIAKLQVENTVNSDHHDIIVWTVKALCNLLQDLNQATVLQFAAFSIPPESDGCVQGQETRHYANTDDVCCV